MNPLTIAMIFSSIATAVQTISMFSAGAAQRKASLYSQTLAGRQADTMKIEAGQQRASGQRAAMEERRRASLVRSRSVALAAASGGSVSDPTVMNLLGDIDTESELRALTAIYQGEESARGLEYGAELTRAGGAGEAYAGRIKDRASRFAAFGTLAQGASNVGSLYAKYADKPKPFIGNYKAGYT